VAPTALLAVDEPRPVDADPLRFSAPEVAAARGYFEHSAVLRHEAATRAAVLARFAGYPVHHLSCHGRVDLDAPLRSALIMAGDEPLTLSDLLDLRLTEPPGTGARLAVLSACETNVSGTDLPDEVTSLAGGLLRAGIAGVIASQWAVREVATAMLMARFYAYWRSDGLDPARALCEAQRWLRDTTNAEKIRYFEAASRLAGAGPGHGLPAATAEQFVLALVLRRPAERSFAHPVLWAAFAHVGS
jgi:CHAT domain-containing protein